MVSNRVSETGSPVTETSTKEAPDKADSPTPKLGPVGGTPSSSGVPSCSPLMLGSPPSIESRRRNIRERIAQPYSRSSLFFKRLSSAVWSDSEPPKKKKRVKTPRQRNRMYRPEPNSLYDLMHQHAGVSLFVRPMMWTDFHVELLNVKFTEVPPSDTPCPKNVAGSPPSRGLLTPSRRIMDLSDALSNILTPSPGRNARSVGTVLSMLWPEAFLYVRYMYSLPIIFHERAYRDMVGVSALWDFPPKRQTLRSFTSFETVSTTTLDSGDLDNSTPAVYDPTGLPMMAYIDLNQVATCRRSMFRIIKKSDNANLAVQSLQKLRAKVLVPAIKEHEPLLVGLFIAMAQRHIHEFATSYEPRSQWSRLNARHKPEFRDIKLRILAHDIENTDFLVYTATITAELLQGFYQPLKLPRGKNGDAFPGMQIQLQRVPIWPILGLRERLGQALGEDIVGSFDPEQVETWDDEVVEEEPIPKPAPKRKALSDIVINGSFEDTSDDSGSELIVSAKRRCLSEGAALGVVR